MKSSGMVSLVFDGKILDYKSYYCKARRNTIIDYWRKLYGQKIEKCFIHIEPNVDTTQIKENGQNIKYPQGIKRKSFDPYFKMIA